MPRPESCGWQTVPTCCPSHPESWKGDEMTLARNAFALLDRTTESHAGDRTAYGFEGEVRTFREMRDASLEVAAGLAANGVGRGDQVAVMMGNRSSGGQRGGEELAETSSYRWGREQSKKKKRNN